MKIVIELEKIGYSEEESKIYTALLNGGKMNTTDIAKKSGIKRTSVYNHIKKLLIDDLILQTTKGKRTYYFLNDPKKIIDLQKTKLQRAENLVPKMSKDYLKHSEKPRVRFYEGKDGVKKVYEEITNSYHPIYSSSSFDGFFSVFDMKEFKRLVNNIQNKNNKVYDLVEDTPLSRKYYKDNSFPETEKIKFLPKDFSLTVDIIIYAKDKMAFISFPSLTATIIEDEHIVKYHALIFKDQWSRY